MKVKKTSNSDTELILEIIANTEELTVIKEQVLQKLAPSVKLAGFRGGKAPLALVEKQVNTTTLQNEFIDAALQQLYSAALQEEQLRVVAPPKVELKKFVPFSTLEFEVSIVVVGEVKLGDYKKLRAERSNVEVSSKEVEQVLRSLQLRTAEKKEVARASKSGDQVWIDFEGKDSGGKLIKGADGKDYPIALGSNTFIPGFEENIIGLKAGQDKEFTLTFPKDYHLATLKGRKVVFTARVKKVQDVTLPKLDDEFAAKAGPVKTLSELKQDIKKQLLNERNTEADRDYEIALINQLVKISTLSVPSVLIEQQVDNLKNETKQSSTYKGQTWQEYLDEIGKTDDEYLKSLQPIAEQRVRTGLVLGAIADKEGVQITDSEISNQIDILRSRYNDTQMQAELDKPEARNTVASRLLTEKTIQKLVSKVKETNQKK